MDVAGSPKASAFGPASMSNLGPGFDTLGLCIKGFGDKVTATLRERSGVTVESSIPLPTGTMKNTAARAAFRVLEAVKSKRGVHLEIEKGIPLGSGIGGSAASAAAGAWATNAVLGMPLKKKALVDAVLDGESAASGGVYHGDNALPALFGGLVLTSPTNPSDYRLLDLDNSLFIALLVPQITVLTSEARGILPKKVPFRTAVENAGSLAFMLHALITGDYDRVADYMVRDRLAEPARGALLPFYDDVRASCAEIGARACAITGSGPAMFALSRTKEGACAAARTMVAAAARAGIHARGEVTVPDTQGVRTL